MTQKYGICNWQHRLVQILPTPGPHLNRILSFVMSLGDGMTLTIITYFHVNRMTTHIDILKKAKPQLMETEWNPSIRFLGHLAGDDAITSAEEEAIKAEAGADAKLDKLITILKGKPKSSYDTFMAHLKDEHPACYGVVKNIEGELCPADLRASKVK